MVLYVIIPDLHNVSSKIKGIFFKCLRDAGLGDDFLATSTFVNTMGEKLVIDTTINC